MTSETDRIAALEKQLAEARDHIRDQAADIMKLGQMAYDDSQEPVEWRVRAEAAEKQLAEVTAERDRLRGDIAEADRHAVKVEALLDPHVSWDGAPPATQNEAESRAARLAERLEMVEGENCPICGGASETLTGPHNKWEFRCLSCQALWNSRAIPSGLSVAPPDYGVPAIWIGDDKTLPEGSKVEILAVDPHDPSVPTRRACWIRWWERGVTSFPSYRSCDLSDLDIADADFEALTFQGKDNG